MFAKAVRNQVVPSRVTTCLENLEMSGSMKHVGEMSGIMLTVRELSGKNYCKGKLSQNCTLLVEYLRSICQFCFYCTDAGRLSDCIST